MKSRSQQSSHSLQLGLPLRLRHPDHSLQLVLPLPVRHPEHNLQLEVPFRQPGRKQEAVSRKLGERGSRLKEISPHHHHPEQMSRCGQVVEVGELAAGLDSHRQVQAQGHSEDLLPATQVRRLEVVMA
jgi:hypothetical protein